MQSKNALTTVTFFIFSGNVSLDLRNKGLEKSKASSTIEATDGTNLRMPNKKELVEKLQKKWKEVSAHLDAVNELTTGIEGFGIHYQSPTDVLKAMEVRALQKEREWTIRKGMAYVNKFVVMSSAAIADVKKDESDKKGKSTIFIEYMLEIIDNSLNPITDDKQDKFQEVPSDENNSVEINQDEAKEFISKTLQLALPKERKLQKIKRKTILHCFFLIMVPPQHMIILVLIIMFLSPKIDRTCLISMIFSVLES